MNILDYFFTGFVTIFAVVIMFYFWQIAAFLLACVVVGFAMHKIIKVWEEHKNNEDE